MLHLTALEQQDRLSRWHLEFDPPSQKKGPHVALAFALWCIFGLLRALLCLGMRPVVLLFGLAGDLLHLRDRPRDRIWSLLAVFPYIATYWLMDLMVATVFYTTLPLGIIALIMHLLPG